MIPMVSCIIPVYKVDEKYLRKCIESVINQTLNNVEIILVDDNNSLDKCGEILEEYKKKDDRIVVIHEENKGLAGARNAGTKIANGKYITYIDGDDYIEKNGLEKLYNYTKTKEYDVIRGQSYKDFQNRKEKLNCNNVKINKEYNKSEIFELKKETLNFNANISSACGALYKTKTIKEKNIYNDEKLKQGSEDVEFSFRLCDSIENAIITDVFFYHYIYNDNSISAYSTDENNYRVLRCFEKIKDNIEKQSTEKKEELIESLNIRLQYVIVTTAISGYFNPKNNEEYKIKKEKMNKFLNENIIRESFKYKYIKKMDIKRKIILILLKLRAYKIIEKLGKIRKREKENKK